MPNLKKATLYIKGMHCPSCEVLMEDKFKESPNIQDVKADFKTQKVELHYTGKIHTDVLNAKIQPFGYQIEDKSELMEEKQQEPFSKRFMDMGIIAIILFILYAIAKEANLIPDVNLGGNLNYLTVFILGLVASTSTCMATSGALFLATVGKQSSKNFVSAISFNVGRVVSYGFFGFAAGMIGSVLITNLKIGSGLTLFASLFMVLLGLDMARIISLGSVIPSGFTKNLFEKLEHRLIKYPRKTAFFLGAITYLLPCGFTQTVQVYALGLANPVESALTMMIFALGTVPALLLIGYFSSFTKTRYYPYFMKVVGVLVFVIGLSYFSNLLALYGIQINPFSSQVSSLGSSSQMQNGYQVIKMNVNRYGYNPNVFTLKKGIPTKWVINGENVFGCQGYLVAPKLGIQKTLSYGENIIEFTPEEVGTINFSCSMGMYRGRFEVQL
jgi:sulfite exporter TauE/SafE/copper chaperone CopZ